MINWIKIMMYPSYKYNKYLLQMKEMGIGGVTSENIDALTKEISKFRNDYSYFRSNYIFLKDRFGLKDVPKSALKALQIKIIKKSEQKAKRCWHPQASETNCSKEKGKVKIIEAHSIQKNKILKSIEENGHVTTYDRNTSDFRGASIGKAIASTFLGFCNKHDAIFYPIEVEDYNGSKEQHFLFAYRAFIVSSHPKIVTSYFMDYGEQSDNDIVENKKIFDFGIVNQRYDIIETDVIELGTFYPIAVSSSFYLDYDFAGTEIPHSDERMEDIFLTVFSDKAKTYVLISFFSQDKHLYKDLSNQIMQRNKIKSDITMLIAHCENVYFNSTYFHTYIEQYKDILSEILHQTQLDYVTFDNNGNRTSETSLTPKDYLNNTFGISFFWC